MTTTSAPIAFRRSCFSLLVLSGIPPAQRERIFEPFYRSGTSATGHRGSGLGLAIVRGFVVSNGGKGWVESLPGQATSFVVELPLTPHEALTVSKEMDQL